jgi:hypothetical protein
MRIRIQIRMQHFLSMRIRIQIQGSDSRKFFIYFFDQKLQFTYPLASIKDVQATGEVFIPQKRISSTSKLEIS